MKKIAVLALLLAVNLSLTACGVEIVDAGNTGVKKVLGKVDETPLPPGFYLINPFTSSITEMDNRVQRMEGATAVYTRDVQQANVQFVLNYSLDPKAAINIYQTVGRDYETKLIPQVVTGSMKNVIGKWNAIDLVANRDKATTEIEQMVAASLATDGIRVSRLELTNIAYQREFEQAVEAKVVAVQRAEEAKNQTVQFEEKAKQQVISAKAEAEAMQIKTEALSKSQSLVAYEAVQKWDGVLPKIVTSGGGSILNVQDILSGNK